MGQGRYSSSMWDDTVQTRSAMSKGEVFKQRTIHQTFNPAGIALRESCDSVDNPHSTPIIIGMDVTGSMGMIPDYMARVGIGALVLGILDKKPVTDPHVMVGAIGDIRGDSAPLQMSQFEADNRIAEQITDLFLEGGGGEQDTESYDLPWLFAATRTSIDSFEKRGKKGYLFTIGDEPAPRRTHTAEELRRVFGNIERGYTSSEMLELAKEKWAVFHIIVEEGSRGRSTSTARTWTELLGSNAIFLKDYRHLPEVIVAVIAAAEGAAVSDILSSTAETARATVAYAFAKLQETVG